MEFHSTKLWPKCNCTFYYQNKLKTERVWRMFKLTTPYFYHSSHYKVSNTQCSQTKCM